MKKRIKQIAAFFIMLCFFLPLSQCHFPEAPKKEITSEQPQNTNQKKNTNKGFTSKASKSFKLNEIKSWLVLLLFSWPVIFITIEKLTKSNRRTALILLSPIACGITIYYIGSVVFLGKTLYGGYIWAISIATFTIISFIEFVQYVKNKI